MTYHSRVAHCWAIAATALLMLGGCGGQSDSIAASSSDTPDIPDSSVANPSPEASGVSEANSSDRSDSDQGNVVVQTSEQEATQETDPETDPEAILENAYAAQPINPAALALINSELAPAEEVIEAHSFALDIPELGGTVDFVASQTGSLGDPRRLNLRFRTPDGEYQPLVPVNQTLFNWNFWQLNAVAFEDINNDGLGPDIVAIAEYMTGAGPEAAKPFPVATVHFKDARGFFAADEATEELLSEQGAATIGEVRSILNR